MNVPFVWLNHRLVPTSDARCSFFAHGLHYGTGVFEGIRAYATEEGPAIFRLDDHLARMARGAEVLGMDLDLASLRLGCLKVLAASGLQDAYLRPLATFHLGGLALDTSLCDVQVMVAALPWQNHLGEGTEGISMRTSPLRRNAARAIPALKLCGGYVNAILAKREAMARGFAEALFVDEQGFVVEATGENLFLVKHGRVVAVDHPDALPGITRATLAQLAGAEVRPVTLEELCDADELFVTGTSAEVTPVTRLDGGSWAPGPVTQDLRAAYLDLVHGRSPAYESWLTRVEAPIAV